MVSLSLENAGVRYGRTAVLDGITSPALEGGQIVALIGPNAAGKSSLLRRIAGIATGPGDVRLSGADRSQIGYMPQDHAGAAALTVFEAVLLARKRDGAWRVDDGDRAAVDRVLTDLGIADLGMRNLGDLSGGQRQTVSLAQVLVCDPRIVLLDEPTSALDLRRQVQMLDFLRHLARDTGLLVLIAIHDLNQVLRFADRVLVLSEGGLQACGTTQEVVTPELLERVYRVQARIERCSRGIPLICVDGAT